MSPTPASPTKPPISSSLTLAPGLRTVYRQPGNSEPRIRSAEKCGRGLSVGSIKLKTWDRFIRTARATTVRPFANEVIKFDLEGPAQIIGDNPFSLVGGTGAIWTRAQERPGTVRLRAVHPYLGVQQVEVEITAAAEEVI